MVRGRRLVRVILIAFGALAALIVLAVAAIVVFVDFDALIAKYRDRAVASASAAIGRPVQIADVEPSWWPIGIEARGVEIEGLAHADALQFEVSLWEIVKSLGKRVEVSSIVLSHPVIDIVRSEDGRFSFADIVEHMKRRPKTEASPETTEMLKRARIDRIAIEDGTITFVDRAAPGGTGLFFVDDVDVSLKDVALGSPARLEVNLGVLSKADNVELSARTGPLPDEPRFESLPEILQVNLRANGIPLRGARLWLPKDTPIDVINSELSADFELTGEGALMGEATIDDLVIAGGPPRTAKLAIDGSAGTTALEIRQARAELGDAAVTVRGRIDRKKAAFTFESDPIDLLAFGLVENGPASVQARGRIAGPPSDAKELVVRIEDFRFVAGPNAITGSGTVDGMVKPRITFEARSQHLDVDALRAMFAKDGEEKESGPPKKIEATVDGTIAAKTGRVSGIEFQNLETHMLYQNGSLVLQTAGLDTYGGRLIADGTRIALAQDPIGYELVARFVAIDADRLLSNASSLGDALDGTLDARIDVRMRGTRWSDFAQTLTGEIGARLENGRFEGVNLVRSVAEPLMVALPFIEQAVPIDLPDLEETQFRELAATFRVNAGQLRIAKPMRVVTDAGTILFTGTIGLDRKIALDGRFELTPDMIAKLTGGQVKPPGPIPVGVDLGCTLLAPCVTGIDVEHAVESLVAMQAKKLIPDVEKDLEKEAQKRLKDVLGF